VSGAAFIPRKGEVGPILQNWIIGTGICLKIVAFMKQKNMAWQLKHKFIILKS
jgi:hypothetical protein